MYASKYILITPARNEQEHIEKTIRSVLSQTIRPLKWIIVSDHSTDKTDEIVEKYAREFPFIEFLRLRSGHARDFGSKTRAFNSGYSRAIQLDYDFICNLDADVSFAPDYFEKLLVHFAENRKLGLASGIVVEKINGRLVQPNANLESVPGAIQFFCKPCFNGIGGFLDVPYGGQDGIAEVTARMLGWQTQSFPELPVMHHREMGTAGTSIYNARWREGKFEYLVGYHPLFHIARAWQRLCQKPFVIGSFIRTLSYFAYFLKHPERPVSKAFVRFIRREELRKLKDGLRKTGKGKLKMEMLNGSARRIEQSA